VRRAEDAMVTAIYLAMRQFLASTGGGIAGLLVLS
jgi:hypothetical protein